MNNIQDYLREYYKKQENILVVYREDSKSNWTDRCLYLGDNYSQEKPYNHRSILGNEVVIEFDDDNPSKNEELAILVGKALKRDGIKYSMWDSGNKSVHIHFFVNTKGCGNIRLLKKVIMRHYTEGLSLKPDMRLAVDNHLIRAEFGLHEATKRRKRLIFKSRDYLNDNNLPNVVWQKYSSLRTTIIKRKTSVDLTDNKCSCINYLANSVVFREHGDGHERALWILLHTLKSKYDKKSLSEFLCDWYKYSGGYKMSPVEIERKVNSQYNRGYGTYNMVKDLLEELGLNNVLQKCEVHRGAL